MQQPEAPSVTGAHGHVEIPPGAPTKAVEGAQTGPRRPEALDWASLPRVHPPRACRGPGRPGNELLATLLICPRAQRPMPSQHSEFPGAWADGQATRQEGTVSVPLRGRKEGGGLAEGRQGPRPHPPTLPLCKCPMLPSLSPARARASTLEPGTPQGSPPRFPACLLHPDLGSPQSNAAPGTFRVEEGP